MLFIVLGLAFILITFEVPLVTGAEASQYIDIFPDFVGYLILWFRLEKTVSVNRWFKDSSTIAAGMMAVTFVQFLGSMSFLLPQNFMDSSTFKFMADIINFIFSAGAPIILALNMVFVSFLCRGLGLSCEDRKKEFLSTVFFVLTIVFFALAAFAAVTLFIRNLPIQVWHIALPAGIVFAVFALIGSRGVKELE